MRALQAAWMIQSTAELPVRTARLAEYHFPASLKL